MKKFELGEKVTLLVVDEKYETSTLEGVITGCFLGVSNRLQYRVKCPGDKNGRNADPQAINCTAEEAAAYVDHMRAVAAKADAINATLQEGVKAGNAEIEAMNTAFMGAPIQIAA